MQMIGTTSSVQTVKRVKYPSISVCQIRNIYGQYSNGIIFNGEEPLKFNATPDLSDFFLGMKAFNENSTIYGHYALQQVKGGLLPPGQCGGPSCLSVSCTICYAFHSEMATYNYFCDRLYHVSLSIHQTKLQLVGIMA